MEITLEQEWRLLEIARRADRINDARTLVIDAPDSEFRDEEQRRRILEVLTEVHDAADGEHSRLRREFGLPD